MSDDEKQPRIVVRDRRAFDRDGSRREGVEPQPASEPAASVNEPTNTGWGKSPEPAPSSANEQPAAAQPATPTEPAAEAEPTATDKPAEAEQSKGDARFQQLVSLLFSQAAILLEQGQAAAGGKKGAATSPQTLAGLQAVIGLLEVLEEKTRGRLAAPDEQLLSRALYELRLAYMQRAKAPGK